ncbi:2Fe-2S iron-sulfur cluster-binding protein [uncultured Sneathiella sp.]|uniref:2Fe-2S iron-sulfur cluster-binding protein n=1 Tax=uncultured Sneathiella sp. TaxID=879315 RepID=UPI0030ED0881|tara:strand:- start:30685 stop:31854 length:1170 start_codon:yes stop_codon:yes gene_type:complete
MTATTVDLTVNGRSVSEKTESRTHLADFLREDLLLTGTHLGCEQGVCGACTVFVDGRPTRSCITLAAACKGANVQSVEGFDDDPLMQALRDAFKRHHGLQCGYCTPGMLVTGYDIVRRLPNADTVRIRKELSGNLCRCTGYAGIVAAIADVLENNPPIAGIQPQARLRHNSEESATAALEKNSKPKPGSSLKTADPTDIPSRQSLDNAPTLSRKRTFDVSPSRIWEILSDPEKIVSCIPGARIDDVADDGLLQGQCAISMGPIKAAFKGTARMELDEVGKTGEVIGRGKDGFSRSQLDGTLDFQITDHSEGGSELSLDMRYKLTGPLSQFSRPSLVAEIADRILDQVVASIEAKAKGENPELVENANLNGLSLLTSAFFGWIKNTLGFR